MKTKLDQQIEMLEGKLSLLDRRSQAAFFAGCAERLIPLYEHFASKEGWGDPSRLRKALDEVWMNLRGGPAIDVVRLIEEIASVTPHGDDFGAPDSTFAQDAAICVDAAIRATSSDEALNPKWIEYPLEVVKVAVCMAERGLVDVGTDELSRAWENRLVENPKMRSDIQLYLDVLEYIGAFAPLTSDRLVSLRERMQSAKWQRDALLAVP